jgi:hypothetical protein
MSHHSNISRCLTRVVATSIAVVALIGCSTSDPATGLGTKLLSVAGDTIHGTGQLAELQQRRAAWVARGISNYRVQLRKSCFCGGNVMRPVLIEVRGGVISKVWDLETTNPIADVSLYSTITGLFDAAIAERSRGGNVTVAYDASLGTPVRLEIGTVANDAGVMYFLSPVTIL